MLLWMYLVQQTYNQINVNFFIIKTMMITRKKLMIFKRNNTRTLRLVIFICCTIFYCCTVTHIFHMITHGCILAWKTHAKSWLLARTSKPLDIASLWLSVKPVLHWLELSSFLFNPRLPRLIWYHYRVWVTHWGCRHSSALLRIKSCIKFSDAQLHQQSPPNSRSNFFSS